MRDAAAELEAAFEALSNQKWVEAEAGARRVLRQRPTSADALYVLGCVASDQGDDAESLRLYRQATLYAPKFSAAYSALSRAYYALGRTGEAADLYRRWQKAEPDDPEVQHMAAAVTGERLPSKCSEGYIKSYFDRFSETFDEVLIKHLAYQGPQLVSKELDTVLGGLRGALDVLDAGCGTGLCGPALRPLSRRLVGVDLSAGMIERARGRGCYDELVVAELQAFLISHPESFDAIVSADVLVYFGELEVVLDAACRALRMEGALVLAVESLTDDGRERFRLQDNGRYAHRASYLQTVLRWAGFELLSMRQEFMRWEFDRKVMFHVISARRSAGGVRA